MRVVYARGGGGGGSPIGLPVETPVSGAGVGWLLSLALLNIQTGLVLMIPTLALASVSSYSDLEHPPPTLPAASSFQPWMSLPPTNINTTAAPTQSGPINTTAAN